MDTRAKVVTPSRVRKAFRGWALALAVALAIALASAWLLLPPTFVTVSPKRGLAVQAVYATGTVEPTVMLPIEPRSAGRLIELDADEGMAVKAGQVLARLESDDLFSAIKQAEAAESYAKSDFIRSTTLLKRGVITKQAYDLAKSNWQSAAAATARARAEAQYMTLVAPTDGHVIKRDGEIGELIAPTQALFWISSSSALRISTDVDEEDVARVQAGQDVLIRADAFPGQIFKGKVESITPKGDPVARTYRVRIHLNELTPLMIGMTAETNIIIHQNPNALLVPNGSIVGSKVWLIKDGTLESRQVRVGSKGTSDSEVISGLSETDVIVLNPSGSLREGSRARSTSKDWKV